MARKVLKQNFDKFNEYWGNQDMLLHITDKVLKSKLFNQKCGELLNTFIIRKGN
ncbi:hypothetical protein [Ornithinibacillus halophilus]|uniref:Uncharacterized protein n=1 Tax=Ornithinibacillus halophilus TaxID=930117 RepID=A0A1M5F243_9BACI|nr:hypothetical protein [Ornithinibacillus halophilus]SHF85569.1 hypothetical protein SAMN05216225_100720 [Ornithinibacillus halophilus]